MALMKLICFVIVFVCLSIIHINAFQQPEIEEIIHREGNFSISPIRAIKTEWKITMLGLTTLPKIAMWVLSIITICCMILLTMVTGFVDYY